MIRPAQRRSEWHPTAPFGQLRDCSRCSRGLACARRPRPATEEAFDGGRQGQ